MLPIGQDCRGATLFSDSPCFWNMPIAARCGAGEHPGDGGEMTGKNNLSQADLDYDAERDREEWQAKPRAHKRQAALDRVVGRSDVMVRKLPTFLTVRCSCGHWKRVWYHGKKPRYRCSMCGRLAL